MFKKQNIDSHPTHKALSIEHKLKIHRAPLTSLNSLMFKKQDIDSHPTHKGSKHRKQAENTSSPLYFP
jgi:hypothetical protein